MARPEKSGDDSRNVTIRLRVTASEKSHIWQNAKTAGRKPSDFLRGLAIGAAPVRKIPSFDREAILRVLAEQNKIGSNLNQIARALNRKNEDGELTSFSFEALSAAISDNREFSLQLMALLEK